jgi:hypothetical protein
MLRFQKLIDVPKGLAHRRKCLKLATMDIMLCYHPKKTASVYKILTPQETSWENCHKKTYN